MAAADALIGTIVGDYKLTGILGEGGMGIVYAAEHCTLGSRTACKVLRREVMDNPDAVARFLQEARLISRVRHRNLIDIFDAGELPDGRLYYIMEYLKGQPLQDRIAAGPRLPFAEILHLLRQIGSGLHAAHSAGIVHRDLNRRNCAVFSQGWKCRGKAAKRSAALSVCGPRCGQPGWASDPCARRQGLRQSRSVLLVPEHRALHRAS